MLDNFGARKFLVSHPTGNTFVRALLEELQRKNNLAQFFTTIGFGEGINSFSSKVAETRKYKIPDCKISRQWFPELTRLAYNGKQEIRRRLTDWAYYSLDQKVGGVLAEQKIDFLHAYEDGAAISFKKAKEIGIQCSYELPIAHWAKVRVLLEQESQRYPEWEPTLESTREPEEKLIRKEEEIHLADRITCPSQFVLQSIPKKIREKIPCLVNPFGSPIINKIQCEGKKNLNLKIKLLFVGSMSQRKGLADLFEAMKILKDEPVSLSILGRPSMPMDFYRKKLPVFDYYQPCSNQKVRTIMQNHDALVLPSIIEGRALVQQEALACGLPIIITPNSGGDDLVENGLTGYLTPIRSPDKIAENILSLLESTISPFDRKIICQQKAAQYSWASYASKIVDFNLSNNPNLVDVTD
ncbi:MAG: hypothetical protein CMC93_01095 [Flavobacteriaceae bacterium]|nr:hypothetical protein [Flavobacteriaceae bacterium]